MSNKKKKKASPKVSPHQKVNDPEKAAVISKLVQNMVKPPETLGQHIKRLGVRALSVDVDGEACIALPLSDLVKAEMAEIAKERDRKKEQLSADLNIDTMSKTETTTEDNAKKPPQIFVTQNDDEDEYPVSSVTG